MRRDVRIISIADREFAEAAHWYQSRRDGLGREFADAVALTVERIRGGPESFPTVAGEMRRAMVPVFPYGVFFLVEGDLIRIVGIIHLARRPSHWRKRQQL